MMRMDRIRNENIRGTAQVGWFGDKVREVRLRDAGYIGRRIMKMELPGKRKRGRPNRRFMDMDMQVVGGREEDAEDRKRWKSICCIDP